MGVYLYCVLPADAADPAVPGIDGAVVRVVREGRVCAWLSDVAAVPRPDLGRIREHHRVIESALAAGVTPVPIRFGQVLPGEAELRAHLTERDYLDELGRVGGSVEFAIRLVDPEPDTQAAEPAEPAAAAAGVSGTAYLRAIADRIHASAERRSRALVAAHELDRELAQWVRERRIEASARPPGASVAHLVQQAAADAYGARARELSNRYPPLHIVVTGPWPPYSFVGA